MIIDFNKKYNLDYLHFNLPSCEICNKPLDAFLKNIGSIIKCRNCYYCFYVKYSSELISYVSYKDEIVFSKKHYYIHFNNGTRSHKIDNDNEYHKLIPTSILNLTNFAKTSETIKNYLILS